MAKGRNKKFLKLFLLVLLAVAVIFALLELTDTTHIFHKKTVPATIPVAKTKATTTQPVGANSTQSTSTATSTQTNTKLPESGEAVSTAPLIQPSGQFVSNHHPGQKGSSMQEQSACDTTPGANCYIQFTNTSSGATTKLPQQVVGADGSTIWSWDAGILTSGNWEVTAVATLNGQTKTATDPIKLEIQ